VTVAALYIDPRGPYPKLCDWTRPASPNNARVHCWDAARDARTYAGPHPVVAHPPCKHWGRLRHLAHGTCSRCGWTGRTDALREERGVLLCPRFGCACVVLSDRDCAPRAVEQVRAYGGVLEHPAGSKLWGSELLPPPYETPPDGLPEDSPLWRKHNAWPLWKDGRATDGFGYTIELDQVEWGHVARKRTWLYLVGVPREALEAPPFPGREPTRSVSGKRGRATQAAHPTWKEQLPRASDTQRRRTPPLFAEYLVRLARAVRR
jgi:hypothetical protein